MVTVLAENPGFPKGTLNELIKLRDVELKVLEVIQ
jgi:hypothetical protein